MTRACVIGAGLGGLALAIRLRAAGHAVTLIEARDAPGGQAAAREAGGLRFDLCPRPFDKPNLLQDLWSLAGASLDDDIRLLPVSPLWRLDWPDGVRFDWGDDAATMARRVTGLAPGDLAGFEQFLAYAADLRVLGASRIGQGVDLSLSGLLAALPRLLRLQAWRTLDAKAAALVRSERLRQALTFRALTVGGNPLAVSAVHALAARMELERGGWWPRGGIAGLARAMAALFERIGGELRLGDPARHIATIGNRATEVVTAGGWRRHFDIVASNADAIHTYRSLLGETSHGMATARKLARLRWSPAAFTVHFALAGRWPGIAHNTVLFARRWEALLEDVFERGVLPRDMLVILSHPTATDPTLAPEGTSLFSAHVPVAHLGKLPIDWETVGPTLQSRVLDEIGRRLIPDIRDRLVACFHTTPRDAALDFNAWQGSANGLEPRLWQDLRHRPYHRDPVFPNLYLAGAATHPGAGFTGVLRGARAVAEHIVRDLAS